MKVFKKIYIYIYKYKQCFQVWLQIDYCYVSMAPLELNKKFREYSNLAFITNNPIKITHVFYVWQKFKNCIMDQPVKAFLRLVIVIIINYIVISDKGVKFICSNVALV